MDRDQRRTAVRAYKEQATRAGVFAVICTATGQAWVGQSRHVDTQQNGLWFTLRLGSCPNRALQAAWTAHGAEAFRYELLDPLPEGLSGLAIGDELKRRAALWTARLGAAAV